MLGMKATVELSGHTKLSAGFVSKTSVLCGSTGRQQHEIKVRDKKNLWASKWSLYPMHEIATSRVKTISKK